MEDPLTATWILEFVLRQPIEDHLANAVLDSLPPSSAATLARTDPRLLKTILLRRIQSDLSKQLVSERILDTLELVERIDRTGLGKDAILPSMKAAYHAVAAECAVKHLRERAEPMGAGVGAGSFRDAVDRFWTRRVSDAAWSEAKLLARWKEWMEKAVLSDEGIRHMVLQGDAEVKALDLVRDYLGEAFKDMGPPLLEIAADKVLNGKIKGLGIRKGGADLSSAVAVPENLGASSFRPRGETVATVQNPEGRFHNNVIDAMEEQNREHTSPVSETELQEENQMTKEQGPSRECHYPSNKFNHIPSPEVARVKEMLKASSANLHAVVMDPLPDSIAIADRVLSAMTEKTANPKESEHNQNHINSDAPDPHCDKIGDITLSKETAAGNLGHANSGRRPKSSLMDRNPTARTYEWNDDSIEFMSEESTDTLKKIQLPSPKRREKVLLDLHQLNKFSRRRVKRRWSVTEEDTLRAAVQKYGKGNWKFILNCYRSVFEGRTEVDLKDKWRNMTR